MRATVVTLTLLCAMTGFAPRASGATAPDSVGTCRPQDLATIWVSPEELAAHRPFPLPVIHYRFGTHPPSPKYGDWGFTLRLRIDEMGRVACYALTDDSGAPLIANDERVALIRALVDWRYVPFAESGHPIATVVSEQIAEDELPRRHLPLPEVPLAKVHIGLERTGCFGTCPAYRVDLFGNGRVIYRGQGYVDVRGRHQYSVPPNRIAALLQQLRSSDLWSLRPAYRAGWTDNATYELTIDLSGTIHHIEDYIGPRAGMPASVRAFEQAVDDAADSGSWLDFSTAALDRLAAEHFPFSSPAGAALLNRALGNADGHDDRAILQLIELGAPLDRGIPDDQFGPHIEEAPLDLALANHRGLVIDALIARGVLNAGDRIDQAKLDAAFRSAVIGGRLALVRKIWGIAGGSQHPSLTFSSKGDDHAAVARSAPVTLLLTNRDRKDPAWEGLAIAQWLIAQGCDMRAARADGETLLHIATQADDPQFVQWLLTQGMDPNTPGEYQLPALGSADHEDVALILLGAGTDVRHMEDDKPHEFGDFADRQHWTRVLAWLSAHGY